MQPVDILAAFRDPGDVVEPRLIAVMAAARVRPSRLEDADARQTVLRRGVLPVDAVRVFRPTAITHMAQHRIVEGRRCPGVRHRQVDMMDEAAHVRPSPCCISYRSGNPVSLFQARGIRQVVNLDFDVQVAKLVQ